MPTGLDGFGSLYIQTKMAQCLPKVMSIARTSMVQKDHVKLSLSGDNFKDMYAKTPPPSFFQSFIYTLFPSISNCLMGHETSIFFLSERQLD